VLRFFDSQPRNHADVDGVGLGDLGQRLAGSAALKRFLALEVRELWLAANLMPLAHARFRPCPPTGRRGRLSVDRFWTPSDASTQRRAAPMQHRPVNDGGFIPGSFFSAGVSALSRVLTFRRAVPGWGSRLRSGPGIYGCPAQVYGTGRRKGVRWR